MVESGLKVAGGVTADGVNERCPLKNVGADPNAEAEVL